MTLRTCALRAGAIALGLSFSGSATRLCAAQGAAGQAAAEALFKQGRDLMAKGQYAEACPKFAESERLDPAPGTLLNLATCYEKGGQIASAWVTYKEAVSLAHKANQEDRARMARDKAAQLEPKLPTLTIVVPASAQRPDLLLRRDGELVGHAEWGVAIPVDPGAHVVEASAPGAKTWQGQVEIAATGTKGSVEVPPLESLPEAPPSVATPAPVMPGPVAPTSAVLPIAVEPSAPSSPGSGQRTAGWIVVGVGVAGLGVGGVLGALALADNNDAKGRCLGSVCDTQGYSATTDAKHAATASTIAFVAGGAIAAVGVVLLLTAPRADKRAEAGRLVIAPLVGVGTRGAMLQGSW
jgi:hypothetical protein